MDGNILMFLIISNDCHFAMVYICMTYLCQKKWSDLNNPSEVSRSF